MRATEGPFSCREADLAGPQMQAPAFFVVPGGGYSSSLGWLLARPQHFASVFHQGEGALLEYQELWRVYSFFTCLQHFYPEIQMEEWGVCVKGVYTWCAHLSVGTGGV